MKTESAIHAVDRDRYNASFHRLQQYRLKNALGLDPVGTRTLLSAPPRAEASDDGSSTTPNEADKSVRVPTYRIIGEPGEILLE